MSDLTLVVEVRIIRQWGGPQQRTDDTVLYWHATATPNELRAIERSVFEMLNSPVIGAFEPLTHSGSKALEALGKDPQVPACPVKSQSETPTP